MKIAVQTMRFHLTAIAAVALLVAGCTSVPSAKNGKSRHEEAGKSAYASRDHEPTPNVAANTAGQDLPRSQAVAEPDTIDAADGRIPAESGPVKSRATVAKPAPVQRLVVARPSGAIENLADASGP